MTQKTYQQLTVAPTFGCRHVNSATARWRAQNSFISLQSLQELTDWWSVILASLRGTSNLFTPQALAIRRCLSVLSRYVVYFVIKSAKLNPIQVLIFDLHWQRLSEYRINEEQSPHWEAKGHLASSKITHLYGISRFTALLVWPYQLFFSWTRWVQMTAFWSRAPCSLSSTPTSQRRLLPLSSGWWHLWRRRLYCSQIRDSEAAVLICRCLCLCLTCQTKCE